MTTRQPALRSLEEELPVRLPERLVEHAQALVGGSVALYVADLEGSGVSRLAGSAALPERLPTQHGIGPELGGDALEELEAQVAEILPGAVFAPLWLFGRAGAVLIAIQSSGKGLDELAREAAPLLEAASRHTDLLDRARRTRRSSAAAETQQQLLSPRLARITGGEIAASLLPSYDVGGDWFDHAENPEGSWLAVADAMGKGPAAAAMSALALGALRAARCAGDGLAQCCAAVDATLREFSDSSFLTAVFATWHAPTRTFSWVRCGHPPPLLIPAAGQAEELAAEGTHPLGMRETATTPARTFTCHERTLQIGDRVVLYSDGITERRRGGGFLGLRTLIGTASSAQPPTAAGTVAAIERAVIGPDPSSMEDDATQLVLRVCGSASG